MDTIVDTTIHSHRFSIPLPPDCLDPWLHTQPPTRANVWTIQTTTTIQCRDSLQTIQRFDSQDCDPSLQIHLFLINPGSGCQSQAIIQWNQTMLANVDTIWLVPSLASVSDLDTWQPSGWLVSLPSDASSAVMPMDQISVYGAEDSADGARHWLLMQRNTTQACSVFTPWASFNRGCVTLLHGGVAYTAVLQHPFDLLIVGLCVIGAIYSIASLYSGIHQCNGYLPHLYSRCSWAWRPTSPRWTSSHGRS